MLSISLLSNFKWDGATGARFNLERRKHLTYESFADKSLEWLRGTSAELVPDNEFWFYSHYPRESSTFTQLVSGMGLSGLTPVAKPYAPNSLWYKSRFRSRQTETAKISNSNGATPESTTR